MSADCDGCINGSAKCLTNTTGCTGATSTQRLNGTTPKCGWKAPCRIRGRCQKCGTAVGRPSARSKQIGRPTARSLRANGTKTSSRLKAARPQSLTPTVEQVQDTGAAPAADRQAGEPDDDRQGPAEAVEGVDADPAAPLERPFENLPELPDDLADAFDTLKLAVLRHKATEWADVSRQAVLDSLDAMKQLALAPSGETADA